MQQMTEPGLQLDRVHIYQRIKGTLDVRLVGVNHYVRIVEGKDPPIYIQGGKFYAEGGTELQKEKLPDWVDKKVANLTEQARIECGLEKPKRYPDEPEGERLYLRDGKLYNSQGEEVAGLNLPTPSQNAPDHPTTPQEAPGQIKTRKKHKAAAQWTCPDCTITMPTTKKGLHIARQCLAKKTEPSVV